MKKPLVIFGIGEIAQMAYFYFSSDSDYDVIAFTVDEQYIIDSEFMGLPVVAFTDISESYPPKDYELFIALSYSKLNSVRKEKYLAAKLLGYKFANYISSLAIILNEERIGENCFILEGNVIQPYVVIHNNITLWSGNHIGHHSVINDHTFIASHVVISGGVTIGEQCFIGVNATIRDHVKIGAQCVIGAGSLLLIDAESGGVYGCESTIRSKIPSSRLRSI